MPRLWCHYKVTTGIAHREFGGGYWGSLGGTQHLQPYVWGRWWGVRSSQAGWGVNINLSMGWNAGRYRTHTHTHTHYSLSYLERNFVAVSPSQNVFTRLDTNWYDKDKTTVQYFKYQMTAKILTHTLIEHETKVQGPTTPMARMNDTWTTILQPVLRRTEVSYNVCMYVFVCVCV